MGSGSGLGSGLGLGSGSGLGLGLGPRLRKHERAKDALRRLVRVGCVADEGGLEVGHDAALAVAPVAYVLLVDAPIRSQIVLRLASGHG